MNMAAKISSLLNARENCADNGNREWFSRHTDLLLAIQKDALPGGSGIDCGTVIDLERSTADKIVLVVQFHHMGDHGMYDGWTTHRVIARPAFEGIRVLVTGSNRNSIRDYLAEVYQFALSQPYSMENQS